MMADFQRAQLVRDCSGTVVPPHVLQQLRQERAERIRLATSTIVGNAIAEHDLSRARARHGQARRTSARPPVSIHAAPVAFDNANYRE